MLCIVPTVGMALSGFQGPELRYASGLFNLMRNLGGAIGIAMVNTWLQDDTHIQTARFSEALGEHAQRASQVLGQLAERLTTATADPSQAHLLAQKLLARIVGEQGLAVAFDDVFRLMAWIFVAALIMVPFCKSLGGGTATAADSH